MNLTEYKRELLRSSNHSHQSNLFSNGSQKNQNSNFKMKFLVVVSALVAVAAAFPSEGARFKRGVFGYGGYAGHGGYDGGYGGYDGLGAVVKGPSGVIAANTGAFGAGHGFGFGGGHGFGAGHAVISAPAPAAAVVAAPAPASAVVAAAAPAHGYHAGGHHGPASISSAPQVAGVINAPSATLIGPSTDGHPGAVIPKGYAAVYGHGHGGYGGHGAGFGGHGAGYHGGYWG